MLVLSRKVGESIVLPDLGVEIKVVNFHGDKIRLGINAPLSIRVYRDEIWQRVQADERESEHGNNGNASGAAGNGGIDGGNA